MIELAFEFLRLWFIYAVLAAFLWVAIHALKNIFTILQVVPFQKILEALMLIGFILMFMCAGPTILF